MKYLNKQSEQKNKDEVDIQSLTGSPSPTAVSDVAKGKSPQTLAEFEQTYQSMHGDVKAGELPEVPSVHKSDCDDIEEAYAMLFEGLAMIARAHSEEEETEEPTEDDD